MKTLSLILLTTFMGASLAKACTLTPIGFSAIQIREVADHVTKFGTRGGVKIRKISDLTNRIRAEIIFQRSSGIRVCRAYDYRVLLNPDCTTEVVSQRGPFICSR